MKAALRPLACDVCAGRLTPEQAKAKLDSVTCSQHLIDILFPEADEDRKPRAPAEHRYYGGERG